MAKYDKASYWGGTGTYEKELKRLRSRLVPKMGEPDTDVGRVLACVSNVYYDVYNNGGGNLLSAYAEKLDFLGGRFDIDFLLERLDEVDHTLDGYDDDDDDDDDRWIDAHEEDLNRMVDEAVEYAIANEPKHSRKVQMDLEWLQGRVNGELQRVIDTLDDQPDPSAAREELRNETSWLQDSFQRMLAESLTHANLIKDNS